MIVICDHDNLDARLALRTALWPSSSPEDHRAEMREILASPHHSAFMARGWTALSLALPRSRCATITSTAANRRRWRFGRDLYRRGRPPPWLGRALNRTGAGVGEAAGVQRAGVGYRHRQSGLPAPACGAGLCRNGAGGVLPQNAGLIRRSCFAADAPAARRAAGSPADRPRQYRTDPLHQRLVQIGAGDGNGIDRQIGRFGLRRRQRVRVASPGRLLNRMASAASSTEFSSTGYSTKW